MSMALQSSRTPLVRPDGMPVRALVVDDEANLSELLRMALANDGWEARTAANGQEALNAVREFHPDIVVLDIMMPSIDGMEVLRRIRAAGNDVPVLFLTAKDAVEDRIAGIEEGGDDYVTKPFNLEEVIARLRRMARRHIAIADDDPRLRVGDLVLDEESYEVERAGTPVALTAKEFELLRFLMRNPRRVLSKAQILEGVWSYDFGGKSSIVEIYISYLRKKIDTLGEPMIHTVRGVGYTIKPA
ncbi:response regulator transcription factor [Agrococcus sp. TF02-05]|uniref:response regulator transcription factor n=1 Tax=Agrococcus sp. TF02-05 TaxID=2815211 RepID=UPI001AA1527C|nr:response regulator transcription factor [Agrococcus sp. TF02-05]MBO1770446.1 response regulator transcription factor [Agrococcus sp. TF02-05]